MSKFFLLFISSFIFINQAAAGLKVGLTHWVGYTNPDETGVYIELLKEIYANEKLEFDFSTYNRMTNLFEQKNYDFVIGVAKEDIPSAFYPNWYLDYDYPINAYFLKSNINIADLSGLNGRVLSWFNGYDFHKYIEYEHDYYPVQTIDKAMSLLFNKRIDAFVDYEYNISEEYKSQLSYVEVLPARPIYLAFSNNKKGQELAATFDEIMQALRESGRLKALFGADYDNARFEQYDANKKKIVIITSDEATLRIYSKGKSRSLEAQLYKLILREMPNYRVEFVKASSENDERQFGINVCFANKIYSQERAKRLLVSKAFSLYLAPRLYSKIDLAKYRGLNDIDELFAQTGLRLGLSKLRKFTSDVQSKLDEVALSQRKEAANTTHTRLQQLAKMELFDVSLEYPNDIATYWHEITDFPIYSLGLNTERSFTAGYLMCKPNDENRRFVGDFDKVLSKLVNSAIYKDTIRKSAVGVSNEEFEDTYQNWLAGAQ